MRPHRPTEQLREEADNRRKEVRESGGCVCDPRTGMEGWVPCTPCRLRIKAAMRAAPSKEELRDERTD